MRIAVTGGAGFIGSLLCQRLLAAENEVLCIDNFYTGRRQNIVGSLWNPNFEILRHNIIDPMDIHIDQIYNLACPASPIHYKYDPVKTIRTNVIGMANVLEAAMKCGARVLQASTSEVYGDPVTHPQTEDYVGHVNQLGPRACYDEGKRCAETLCYDYKRQYDLDVRVARIFNTYGPNMAHNDGRVVSNFIVAALNKQPMVVYGDGSQTRSFCFVNDLVDGLIALMNSDNERAGSAPVNLGNPDEYTILELAGMIGGAVGHTTIEFVEMTEDDPKQRQPDISVAKQILDWKPEWHILQGLDATIRWFEHNG